MATLRTSSSFFPEKQLDEANETGSFVMYEWSREKEGPAVALPFTLLRSVQTCGGVCVPMSGQLDRSGENRKTRKTAADPGFGTDERERACPIENDFADFFEHGHLTRTIRLVKIEWQGGLLA